MLTALRAHGTATPDALLALARLDPLRYAEALATLWHLVATEQIGVDLDRLLTPYSVLRARTDGGDGDVRRPANPGPVDAGENGDGPR